MSFLGRHYFRSVLTLRISPDPGMQCVRPLRAADADQDSGIQLMECDKAFWGILISHLGVDIQNVSCNLSNATKDECESPITVLADILYELIKYCCVMYLKKTSTGQYTFFRNIIYFLLQKTISPPDSVLYSHYKSYLNAQIIAFYHK